MTTPDQAAATVLPEGTTDAGTEAAAEVIYSREGYNAWQDEGDKVRDRYRRTARAALAAALPALRQQIVNAVRERRPARPTTSLQQEAFQKGYDAAVHQLDLAVACGGSDG